MGALEKLNLLGAATKYDICTSSHSRRRPTGRGRVGAPTSSGICHSFTPDGRCVSLLKTLFTNACYHDCRYCANSTSCSKKPIPTTFEPDELCRLFLDYYRRNFVEGLFLSSGVIGSADRTTEKMIETAERLRRVYHFEGYVHLKVLPGVDQSHLRALCGLADRVSVNLEAPSAGRLGELSSTKDFGNDLERRMSWISSWAPPSGQTTQFVLGPSGESDVEYLAQLRRLYSSFNVRRAYFSAFEPCVGTPLENSNSIPLVREHRLYEADWLLRVYGFGFDEVKSALDENGNLPLTTDVKSALATAAPDRFPLDPNEAAKEDLLRVPGIGPLSAERIVAERRRTAFASLAELQSMGVVTKRAAPFLELHGIRQATLQWT